MKTKKLKISNSPLANASTVRRELMRLFGRGAANIDGKKNINEECGYPDNPTIDDYKLLFDREGVATRVCQVLPEETWSDTPEVLESESKKDSKFEKEWKDICTRFNMFGFLELADTLSGIGRFGVLLFGFKDGRKLDEPVKGYEDIPGTPTMPGYSEIQINRKFRKVGNKKVPVVNTSKRLELAYIRAFDESVVRVDKFDNNVSSPRFGQPLYYLVKFTDPNDDIGGSTPVTQPVSHVEKRVHWSRVIHLADNRKNSLIFGQPRMKAVINRLIDIRKLLGGSAEMYWQGGFPGLAFEMDEKSDATLDPVSIRNELDEYMNGLRRYIAIQGLTAKSLTPQIADPTPALTAQIKAICISKGFTFSIFMGSEGTTTSDLDRQSWTRKIRGRRNKYASPWILRPVIDRLIDLGVIAEPKKGRYAYHTRWPDIEAPTEKAKSEIAVARTNAIANYINSGSYQIIPPREFFVYVMDFEESVADELCKKIDMDALMELGADPTSSLGGGDFTELEDAPEEDQRPPRLIEEGAKHEGDPVKTPTRRSDRVTAPERK